MRFHLPRNGIGAAEATSAFANWLGRRHTPICWLAGPSGAGKTASVRDALSSEAVTMADGCHILPLSVASPERCLHQLFDAQAGWKSDLVNTARLLALPAANPTKLFVLDALDVVQQQDDEGAGLVTDLRLRLLLSVVASGRWPGSGVVVTSRLKPPPDLRQDAVFLIELPGGGESEEAQADSSSHPVLEIIASSRQASSGWLLGLLTGEHEPQPSLATPAAVGNILGEAGSSGVVERIGGLRCKHGCVSKTGHRDIIRPSPSPYTQRTIEP